MSISSSQLPLETHDEVRLKALVRFCPDATDYLKALSRGPCDRLTRPPLIARGDKRAAVDPFLVNESEPQHTG